MKPEARPPVGPGWRGGGRDETGRLACLRENASPGCASCWAGQRFGSGTAGGLARRLLTLLIHLVLLAQTSNAYVSRVTASGAGRARSRVAYAQGSQQAVVSNIVQHSTRASINRPVRGGFSDGPASTARFHYPQGLVLSPQGEELYIVDGWNHRLRRADLVNGLVSTIAGSSAGFQDGPADSARFHYPHSATVTSDGTKLFVSDGWNQRIRVVSLVSGEVFTLAGTGSAGYRDGPPSQARFYYPAGLAISPDGRSLFVADTWNSRVRRIDIATGNVDTVAGGVRGYSDGLGTQAKFSFPRGVCISPVGDVLYVADTGNNCIRRVNVVDGHTETIAGNQLKGLRDGQGKQASFTRPISVVSNADSSMLFVTDTGNAQLRAVEIGQLARGEYATVYTVSANKTIIGTASPLKNPFDLSVTPDGRIIYVTDRDGQCVRRWFLPTGVVSTLAGSLSDAEQQHLSQPVYTRGVASNVQVVKSTLSHVAAVSEGRVETSLSHDGVLVEPGQNMGLDNAFEEERTASLRAHNKNLAQVAPLPNSMQGAQRFRGRPYEIGSEYKSEPEHGHYTAAGFQAYQGAVPGIGQAPLPGSYNVPNVLSHGDGYQENTGWQLSHMLILAVFAGTAVGVVVATTLVIVMLKPEAIEYLKPCIQIIFFPVYLVLRAFGLVLAQLLKDRDTQSVMAVCGSLAGALGAQIGVGLRTGLSAARGVLRAAGLAAAVFFLPAWQLARGTCRVAVALFPQLEALGPPLQRLGSLAAGLGRAAARGCEEFAWRVRYAFHVLVAGKKRHYSFDGDARTLGLPPRSTIKQLPAETLSRLQEVRKSEADEGGEGFGLGSVARSPSSGSMSQFIDALGGEFLVSFNRERSEHTISIPQKPEPPNTPSSRNKEL